MSETEEYEEEIQYIEEEVEEPTLNEFENNNQDEEYQNENIEEQKEEIKPIKIKKIRNKITQDEFGLFCKTCYCIFHNKKDSKNHICKRIIEKVDLEVDLIPRLVIEKDSYKRDVDRLKNNIMELEMTLKNLRYKTDLINKIYSEVNKITFEKEDSDNIFVEINLNKDKKRKEYFRVIAGDKAEEKTEDEIKLVVKNAENELNERGWKYFNFTKEEILNYIDDHFRLYINDRKVSYLELIKDRRCKLLKFYSLEEYTTLCHSHLKKIENIDGKLKWRNEQVFSLLECRLLFLSGYSGKDLSLDEMAMINLGLEYKRFSSTLKPFNKMDFYKKLQTIDLAYCSLPTILRMELVKPDGLRNLVFTNSNLKQKLDDPFTYYYLDKVEKDKRLWKMDWRLMELAEGLKNNLLSYMKDLFKKFYYTTNKDNTYRKDRSSKQLGEMIRECEQLLENIILISNYSKYLGMLQNLIKENCFYVCTINDKIDLSSDDKELAKSYENINNKNYEDETLVNINDLFEDMSKEDVIKLYKERINLN